MYAKFQSKSFKTEGKTLTATLSDLGAPCFPPRFGVFTPKRKLVEFQAVSTETLKIIYEAVGPYTPYTKVILTNDLGDAYQKNPFVRSPDVAA